MAIHINKFDSGPLRATETKLKTYIYTSERFNVLRSIAMNASSTVTRRPPPRSFVPLVGGKVSSKLAHAYQWRSQRETINMQKGLYRYNYLHFGVALAPFIFQWTIMTIHSSAHVEEWTKSAGYKGVEPSHVSLMDAIFAEELATCCYESKKRITNPELPSEKVQLLERTYI